jgi:hypothetical protein
MSVPPRFVVELRPPRKGERILVGLKSDATRVAAEDFTELDAWVIVDHAPADPAPSLNVDLSRPEFGIGKPLHPDDPVRDTTAPASASVCPVAPLGPSESTNTAKEP